MSVASERQIFVNNKFEHVCVIWVAGIVLRKNMMKIGKNYALKKWKKTLILILKDIHENIFTKIIPK